MGKEYWDSNLFLTFLQNKPEEIEDVEIVGALLRKAEQRESLIIVSTVVIAEIRPRTEYDKARFEVVQDLFYSDRPYVQVSAVSPRIADFASVIGGRYNKITVPDAIHVATACIEDVDVLLTFDGPRDKERRRSGDLLHYDRVIHKPIQGDPLLRIERPTMPLNSQLLMRDP